MNTYYTHDYKGKEIVHPVRVGTNMLQFILNRANWRAQAWAHDDFFVSSGRASSEVMEHARVADADLESQQA